MTYEPDEIAYVFGGAVSITTVRSFMQLHDRLWMPQEQTAWENDPRTTLVRAIGDPSGETPTLCGVILLSVQRRHVRIERVVVGAALRRKQIATNMFYSLVLDPRLQQYATISAICPDNNDAGIGWLKNCRFQAISVLPADKDNDHDQYLFSWSFQNIRETIGDENAKLFDLPVGVDPASGDGGYPFPLPDSDARD